jgi:IS30 family transposase
MKQATKYSRLTANEREEISRALAQAKNYDQIAARIGRETSTISRELSRLRYSPMSYRAILAQEVAERKRNRRKTHKLLTNERLRHYVEDKLLRNVGHRSR